MLTKSSEAVLSRTGGYKGVWHKQSLVMVTQTISLIIRTEILLNKIILIPSRHRRKHFNSKCHKKHLTSVTGKFWKDPYKHTNLRIISICNKKYWGAKFGDFEKCSLSQPTTFSWCSSLSQARQWRLSNGSVTLHCIYDSKKIFFPQHNQLFWRQLHKSIDGSPVMALGVSRIIAHCP